MTPTNPQGNRTQGAGTDAIRPFQMTFPESELTELRRRISATRWPERETVTDATQGVQLATAQALARYWVTDYDWRRCETKLNALPQFITEIDGLDIQFIHVRSNHENALPLIVTHGWPGSITEQMKIIEPLTNPTAHGGSASDAFHLVIPSLPGYASSGENNKVFGREQSFVAGDSTNVQFMVKDSTKYASTGGWGFAQFKNGKPDGKADLKTCFPCHVPVKARDLVFTRYTP